MTRASKGNAKTGDTRSKAAKAKQPTRLDQLETLLKRKDGASVEDMTKVTGWQPHSICGAIAGALKKRGNVITSEKKDSIRRYRIESAT